MKIKSLTKEQIITALNRLTNFRFTEMKYTRVFKEIILSNLIEPTFSKYDLERISYKDLKFYAQEILNYSIKEIFGQNSEDLTINKKLYAYEKSVAVLDENATWLLKNRIDYHSCLELIDEHSSQNLRWLKALASSTNILEERKKQKFKYPIEVVVLVEGATEEILLPKFSKLYGFDFDTNGVYLIAAGGKNQVVKIYYELYSILKLPIFVLFDKDGIQNAKEIERKIRKSDKIHIIKCGEFEDALPKELVKRTLEQEFENISEINTTTIEEPGHRVKYLEEIFKHRGRHEFKKVEFSQIVAENITSKTDLTLEIIKIIEEIKKLKSKD